MVIIAVIVVSFVIYFSPYSRTNPNVRGAANLGSINGERIAQEDFGHAWREVQLRYFFLSGGHFLDEESKRTFDPERETYQWLLLLQNMRQMGIQVSDDGAAATARQMLGQFQRAGVTSADVFAKQILEPHGLNMEDFERFVKHFLGIQELIATVGLSGKLVTPQEAGGLYVREHQDVASEAVFFVASNYLASVAAPPGEVSQFYTNRLSFYRVPDRVQVSYVKWDLTNYQAQAKDELAKLTNLDEQIDAAYQKDASNFLGQVKAPTLEKAKEKIRDMRLKDFELQSARKAANAFATTLFDLTPQRPENLELLAKSNNLPVQVSEPFDEVDGPKDLNVAASFVKAAFALSPNDEPVAGPLVGEDAVFVIAFNKKIPSEIPPYDQISGEVLNDFRNAKAMDLARKAGEAFAAKLTNGLAQGKTFAALCAENNLKPVELPPFSISTRSLPIADDHGVSLNGRPDHGQLGLKQLAFGTPPGKASSFDLSNEGGLILYVRSQLPLDQAKMQADLPAYINGLRLQRQNEVFQQWFGREAQTALRDTPVMQHQQGPPANMQQQRPTPSPSRPIKPS